MTTSEKLNIAGNVSPDFTALGLFFAPRVEGALLRRTKNLTSRPWGRKTFRTAIVSKHYYSPSRGLQPGASDKLPSQP